MFKYTQSEQFKNAREKLPDIIAEYLDAESKKKMAERLNELNEQIVDAKKRLQTDPNDQEAKQQQISAEISENEILLYNAQKIDDARKGKEEEIQYLKQYNRKLKNEFNVLNARNQAYQKMNEENKEKDSKSTNSEELDPATKEQIKQIEEAKIIGKGLQKSLNLRQQIRDQEYENKILEAQKEAYATPSTDLKFMQQEYII